jgi:hypothetical protein
VRARSKRAISLCACCALDSAARRRSTAALYAIDTGAKLLRNGMSINIDKLTESELIDLNNRIVERLKFLSQMRAHAEMLEYRIGDRVAFQPSGRGEIIGMLTRYNRKTVTIITDDGSAASRRR